jgi:hypothetical protein
MAVSESRWNFFPKPPKAVEQTPKWDEFFNTDGIKDNTDKLIREAIQNSLDASVSARGAEPGQVRVRFFVSGERTSLRSEQHRLYFGTEYWTHLRESLQGQSIDVPDLEHRNCRLLTVEDFGTRGLEGNHLASQRPLRLDEDNHFYFFFRAEGGTRKHGNDRGRWGVGKNVFPSSSDARCFFGLTVRHNDPGRRLLLGKAILYYRTVDGQQFDPHCWFGLEKEDIFAAFDSNDPAQARVVTQFEKDWQVTRSTEPGLSVVVPFIDDAMTPDHIARRVIENYMLTIAEGALVVDVEGDDSPLRRISSDTLDKHVASLYAGDSSRAACEQELDVVKWYVRHRETPTIETQVVGPSPGRPDILTAEQTVTANEALRDHGRLLVKVQTLVARRGGSRSTASQSKDGQVHVVLASDDAAVRPKFIRRGVVVPSAGGSTMFNNLRVLVAIPPGGIGDLLGDAEGPAHENWNGQRKIVTNNFQNAQEWVNFIKGLPRSLVDLIRGAGQQKDDQITVDWFPSHDLPEDEPPPHPDLPRPVKPILPPTPPWYSYHPLGGGGFTFRLTPFGCRKKISQVRITLAYDVRRGSATAHYRVQDFDLEELKKSRKITIAPGTGRILSASQNVLVIEITQPKKFTITVRGFDPNRDLFLDPQGSRA